MRTFIFFICVLSALALEEGENCTDKGQDGVCTIILKCSGAIDDLRKSPPILPKKCGFDGNTPIICCASKSGGKSGPMRPGPMWSLATPRKPSTSTTTTEYTPEEEVFEELAEDTTTCKPLKIQAKSTDRKAWKSENCTDKGQDGVCTIILKCSGAIDDLRKSPPILPKKCGFDGNTPIICCASKSGGKSGPMRPGPMWSLATPRKPSTSTTTTEYTPEEEVFEELAEDTTTCKPLKIQAKSTDRKAWKSENCTDKGQDGVCTIILKCSGAIDDLRKSPPILPKKCGFDGDTPIICCASKSGGQSGPMRPEPMGSLTTPRKPSTSTTTTEYTPEEEVFEELVEDTTTCKPLKIQAKSTDRKAWKKCLQYQEEFIYPCENSKALLGGKVRGNNCKHNVAKLIVGGVDAGEAEFPHIVMLSHNSDPENLEFSCGGTLLSDWFILTAAHCTYKRSVGPVTYAVLGVLKVSRIDKNKVYKIDKVIKHPNYQSPMHYDDIALLKTDKMMHLNMFAVPACLDVGSESDDSRALATGWGARWNRGENSDTLQKVIVNKFDDLECRRHYTKNDRRIPDGYKPSIQMCYGDRESAKDACTGDSGGPLQVKMEDIKCMYAIIGVTSFGGHCGTVGVPGIYTRVSNYVPWIEEIVWPDD